MKVLLRVDASLQIGTGHVMRCLTLARGLRSTGADCQFASRDLPGNLLDKIAAEFPLHRLPPSHSNEQLSHAEAAMDVAADLQALQAVLAGQTYDWCVLDHYGLDWRWEQAARGFARRILMIDDLPRRSHVADLLLDHNLLPATQTDTLYPWPAGHPPLPQQRLFGPQFCLLRPEFAALRQQGRAMWADDRPRLLLFFGGGNAGAVLSQILPALLPLPVWLDVVIGGGNPARAEIATLLASQPHARLHIDTPDMARLMHQADLFVGAGGTVTWERACLGLPGVVAALAENQQAIAAQCADWGMQRYLGPIDLLTAGDWLQAIGALLAQPVLLAEMRQRAAALSDGQGVARVIERMSV